MKPLLGPWRRALGKSRHCTVHIAVACRMVNKHCAYGVCNSDSRYRDRPHMKGVDFIYFPQYKKYPEKCARWVKLCGRPTEGYRPFTVSSVTKDTYICTKHFVEGQGPTVEHPDPIPAVFSDVEKRLLERRKKRKPPKQRPFPTSSISTHNKRARKDQSADLPSSSRGEEIFSTFI